MTSEPLLEIELPGIPRLRSGKVREIFDLGDELLMVATDRISAFDVILPNGIPHKGEVLTRISCFWFRRFESLIPHHLIAGPDDPLPPALQPYAHLLRGRSMRVRKAEPLPIECIVRGYLAGSAWKEYRQTGGVGGLRLPPGLRESEELPEPIFTPSTKARHGHDVNISFEEACRIVGEDLAYRVRELSLRIYAEARAYARSRGIIIADTKFEFGRAGERLLLIDEVLTPDSSRFWPADRYEPGRSQPSFDKQFVRDYLESLDWDKTPPGPILPPEIVAATSARYREAYERLTGQPL